MIRLIALILILSNQLYANDENCSPTGSLTSVKILPCFNEEFYLDELEMQLSTKDKTSKYCQNNCHDPLKSKLSTKPENNPAMTAAVGKATFDEFQKSLTFLTLDLMKMRNSYALDFDPSSTVKTCNLKSNLQKPSCMPEKEFRNHVSSIQNSLATELAILVKDKSQIDSSGLLNRKPNSCEISDKDALYVKNKYTESLLTPELLAKFKGAHNPKLESFEEMINASKDSELKTAMLAFRNHPMLNRLFSNKKNFNEFINKDYSKKSILEVLYSKSEIDSYKKSLEQECTNLYKNTSGFLEEIYCKGETTFSPDNSITMQIVANKKLTSLSETDAESKLQEFCSYLNASPNNAGFSEIITKLNGSKPKDLREARLENFKDLAYDYSLMGPAENICNGLKNKNCSIDSKATDCLMASLYNQSKTSPEFIKLSKASNENINQIIQSLVGDGLPQVDGKPSTQDIALLKAEGILPGGDASTRTSQPTVASFQKAVSSAQASQPTQAPKPQFVAPAPGKTDPESQQPNYMSSAATRTEDSDDDDSSSQATHTKSPKSKTSPKANNKFSNLSDDEQQRIMDLMKRSKKAGGKSPTASESDDEIAESDSVNTIGNSMAGIASQSATTGSAVAGVANAASQAASTAKKAVLDPTKKANSLNDAMVDAHAGRSVASASSASSSPSGAQVSVSKTSANENEIKIKVAETELSQVNEFKEKLKVLLNAHSQEISVAGAGEKFVVKLNNFEINVVFNNKLNTYEAVCKDATIPADYLKTISNYFNVTLKSGSGRRESLIKTLKQG